MNRLEKAQKLQTISGELYRAFPASTSAERMEANRLASNASALFISEIWAGGCVKSLRFFREFGQYPPTPKDEKVMSRNKKR